MEQNKKAEPTESEKQLKELQAKHGKVYAAMVPLDDDDETKVANIFVKKLDRVTYSMVNTLVKKGDSAKAVEACLKAIYVGGDDLSLILNSDDALMSAEDLVIDLLHRRPAVLKKK